MTTARIRNTRPLRPAAWVEVTCENCWQTDGPFRGFRHAELVGWATRANPADLQVDDDGFWDVGSKIRLCPSCALQWWPRVIKERFPQWEESLRRTRVFYQGEYVS